MKVSFGSDGPNLDMALHTITCMRIILTDVCKAAQFVSERKQLQFLLFDARKCALRNICTC
jgi:hypothetical protein